MPCFLANSFYTCKTYTVKKIRLLTYMHLENSSRGRRVLAVGKVVSEKMILPDLQESQKRVICSSHRKNQNSSFTDFRKATGAQQPAYELITVMQTRSRHDS